MKYKCVVSDLDRTILRRNGTISSKTEEVLNKLVDDHVFFLFRRAAEQSLRFRNAFGR